MSETVEQRVKNCVARQLGIDDEPIELTQDIFDDLGADSLDAIELCMDLEEEFETDITDEQMEGVRTIQQIVDLVKQVTA